MSPPPVTAKGCFDRPIPTGHEANMPSESVHAAWPRGFLGTER